MLVCYLKKFRKMISDNTWFKKNVVICIVYLILQCMLMVIYNFILNMYNIYDWIKYVRRYFLYRRWFNIIFVILYF